MYEVAPDDRSKPPRERRVWKPVRIEEKPPHDDEPRWRRLVSRGVLIALAILVAWAAWACLGYWLADRPEGSGLPLAAAVVLGLLSLGLIAMALLPEETAARLIFGREPLGGRTGDGRRRDGYGGGDPGGFDFSDFGGGDGGD